MGGSRKYAPALAQAKKKHSLTSLGEKSDDTGAEPEPQLKHNSSLKSMASSWLRSAAGTPGAGRAGTPSTGRVSPSPSSTRRREGNRTYSRASFFAAEKTSAVRKINEGDLDELTVKDMKLLFDVIDSDCNGMIDFEEIRNFLKEVLDPPCADHEIEAIYNLTDQNDDGTVSPEEIHKALTSGPVKRHLQQLVHEGQVRRRFDEMQGLTAEVDRDLLFEKVNWRVHRDDAFRTLPITTCYIFVFICVVATHLQIWERQQVERGLEAWINGYGKELVGPFLKQAVANVESTGFWLRESGLAAVFGECETNSAGEPWCRLATRNVLVGDVELQQRRKGGSYLAEWLLHDSEQVRSHLAARPRDYLNATVERVRYLWESRWVDEDTEEIRLSFSTYNRRARMFTVTEVIVSFLHGFVAPTVVASAAVVDPYPDKAVFALDALYCCFLLPPLLSELKDLITTCRLQGMVEGCTTYWGFWNFIDWLSILIGSTGIAVWVLCCIAMQDPSIQVLLGEDVSRKTLVVDVMQMDVQSLTAVKDSLSRVIWLFFCLHFVMAANVVTIMLKFFKAFQANPRLQLVTATFAKAGDDMFHWAVVFAAIFIGFALSGNILFGGDLVQFNSVGASMNTAFRTLMGEFDWYIEEFESDLGLGSGMPKEVLIIWYWGYMVLVMLILLNMLLAIILEHYVQLVNQVKNQEVPSIFSQAWGYVRQSRMEKGFVPLSTVLTLLEDEDDPAHPDSTVTPESLMKAFTMKDEQAELLMDWLQRVATERQKKEEGGDDPLAVRLETVEGFAEAIFEQLRVVCLNVSTIVSNLNTLAAAQPPAMPAKEAGGPGDGRRRSSEFSIWDTKGSRRTPSGGWFSPFNRNTNPASPNSRQSAWGQSLSTGVSQLASQLAKQRGAVRDLSGLASELRKMAPRVEPPKLARQAKEQVVAKAKQLPSCLASHCSACYGCGSARSSSAPPCRVRVSGSSAGT